MTSVKNGSAMPIAELRRLPWMAESGSKGGVPKRVQEHAFDVANRRIDELRKNGESESAIGARWGVSQNTINKIRQRTGGMGVKTLYGMRLDLRISIDEILGLPPFTRSETPAPVTVTRTKAS